MTEHIQTRVNKIARKRMPKGYAPDERDCYLRGLRHALEGKPPDGDCKRLGASAELAYICGGLDAILAQ